MLAFSIIKQCEGQMLPKTGFLKIIILKELFIVPIHFY